MRKLALVAALALVAPTLGQAAPTVAPQTLKASDCGNFAVLGEVWASATTAYEAHDLAKTKTVTDSMIAACGAFSTSMPPRVLRSLVAQSEKDAATVLSLLEPIHPAVNSFGAEPAWMKLRAFEVVKDEAGFSQERDRLLDAVDKALGDPAGPLMGKRLETFDVGPNHVSAYQVTLNQGQFRRDLEFIIHRDGPFAEPISILVTYDSLSAEMASMRGLKGGADFLDGYSCAGHFTLQIFAQTPTYDQAKAAVVAQLSSDKPFGSGSISSTIAPRGQACAFTDYISPGLAPPASLLPPTAASPPPA